MKFMLIVHKPQGQGMLGPIKEQNTITYLDAAIKPDLQKIKIPMGCTGYLVNMDDVTLLRPKIVNEILPKTE